MHSIPIERHRLPNGLRVILSRDTATPIVAVNLWYDVGSKHERPGKTGFAHLFEHMMFQGSKNLAKNEHYTFIQSVGGSGNASTHLDRTNYYETLPSHELELAIWLEAERMANLLPAVTQEKLDNQRDVVKNERRSEVDNVPYGTWDEKLQELLFPESHPYHHSTMGSMEDLSAAKLEDVKAFFSTYYCPNNAVLTIAGDFEPGAALGMIDKHFGPIPANPDLPAPLDVALDPFLIGSEVREVIKDQVPLPRVYLGYRIPIFGSQALDALQVASDLLANGLASRLYGALVRERQVAQDVVAFPFSLVGGASILAIWATGSPSVEPAQLESELLTEIDRLAGAGPGDDELARVRNLHSAETASSLERISERADRLSQYTCLFDEPERINTEDSRYEAVTADDVRAAMTSFVRPDNRVVLTYLPAES
ncbi:MAG: insulinase family protein [Chloroflexota bacterium]|nr:insulinase family protein [Chloroflexota bacterium]